MGLSTRTYTRGERIADRLIHRIAIPVAVVGVSILVVLAAMRRDALLLVAVGLYGFGLLAMLVASALANHDPEDRSPRHERLERWDHAAILLLIAGTYTPFTLKVLAGPWGWALLAFVWTVALTGIVLKLAGRLGYARSIALYLVLGWSILPALQPLVGHLALPPLALLVAGGVLYSLGVLFFLATRLPYHTAVWHGMVLLAAGCHYAAVLTGVVLPLDPVPSAY